MRLPFNPPLLFIALVILLGVVAHAASPGLAADTQRPTPTCNQGCQVPQAR